ncbi:DUF3592 domain-containing protein [Legionella dresdenensis]|uniref:DUF3592 domain-containing protein n=1 Tax=Legionella dresdenensis TaxID=450200 RepID=A0ABV8CD60_9GAMM
MNWLLSWRGLIDIAWLVFLLAMLRHFWQERWFLSEARYWLIVKGRITRLEWSQEGSRLWPKIEYSYQVNERDFLGEYLFLDTSHNTPNSRYARKLAYQVAMAFKKDEEITVFYNPDNPTQSALDVHIPTKLNLIIGLIMFLIIVHLGVIVYRLL